jgi:hypothetical protein
MGLLPAALLEARERRQRLAYRLSLASGGNGVAPLPPGEFEALVREKMALVQEEDALLRAAMASGRATDIAVRGVVSRLRHTYYYHVTARPFSS